MAEPVTMLRTLESVKKTIEAQTTAGGTLTSIDKTFLGPAHNPAKYPIIAVVPVEESPQDIWNDRLNSIRRIRIEAFSHKNDSKASMRSSMGLIEQVKNLFVAKAPAWLIPDPTTGVDMMFDTNMVDIEPNSVPSPYRNGFITSAAIDLYCFSRDELHPDVKGTSFAQLVETDSKTLVDTIRRIYKTYDIGIEDQLSSVKSFKSFTLPPAPVYPVLFVGIEAEQRSHKYVGRDEVIRSITIYVLNKLLKREDALAQNLKIIDLCRRIFFANRDLEGRASHFDYRGIVYGQLTLNNQLLYGSSLNLDIQSIEALPVEV